MFNALSNQAHSVWLSKGLNWRTSSVEALLEYFQKYVTYLPITIDEDLISRMKEQKIKEMKLEEEKYNQTIKKSEEQAANFFSNLDQEKEVVIRFEKRIHEEGFKWELLYKGENFVTVIVRSNTEAFETSLPRWYYDNKIGLPTYIKKDVSKEDIKNISKIIEKETN